MDTWHDALGNEKRQPYFQEILNAVRQERLSGQIIYPPAEDVFNAFRLTAFDRVKVVILGQDPYHGAGQAHGLAFSVRQGIRIPPSLLNIYKELETDINGSRLPDGLGGAGRIASEHGFDGACRTGAFARPFRLGTLYRYRHQAACGAPQAPCLHVVGWVCATKKETDRQSKSFDTDRTASVSSVGISRFFRLPPFFTGKQLFEPARYRSDKLEAVNADIAVAAGVLKSRLICNFHLLGKTLWQSKKNQLYASLWAGCDELRGGMDASLYKELCAYAIVFKICF